MHISRRKYYWKHVFIGSHHLIFETATRWTEATSWKRSGGQSVLNVVWLLARSWHWRLKAKWSHFPLGNYQVSSTQL